VNFFLIGERVQKLTFGNSEYVKYKIRQSQKFHKPSTIPKCIELSTSVHFKRLTQAGKRNVKTHLNQT